MRCYRHTVLFAITVVCLLILQNPRMAAAITLPWSTTFDCNDWNQYTDPLNCDGLSKGGGWTCTQGGTYYEQITAAANNPNGGGGKGQRHWVGDGSNNQSGGTALYFDKPQKELWIRWYLRYQPGFKWSYIVYNKLLYIHTDAFSVDAVPEWYNADDFSIAAQGGSGHNVCNHCGWNTLMGGPTSDGKWHALEVHIKMDTNGSNGVAEAWMDGIQKLSVTNVNFGTQPGWSWMQFPSNQSSPSNGGCFYLDYDDLAISNTGYIGLLPPAGTKAKPSPPTNLH